MTPTTSTKAQSAAPKDADAQNKIAPTENDELVAALVASYHTVGGINHIDCANLPSKHAVGEICQILLQLLFPGYHDERALHSEEVPKLTARRIDDIRAKLCLEVRRSLNAIGAEKPVEIKQSQKMCCEFLSELPAIRELLSADVTAAYEGDPAALSYDEIILSYPCVEAIAIQRCAHVLHRSDLPLTPRMMTEWAHSRTGIDIHPGASIGRSFFIDHGTGVVIGETCVIGDRVKLYHGVTLGARSFPKDKKGLIVKGNKRHPNVQDDVTIYPNAAILGGETTIGARSSIGANVFLMRSVPPDSLVAYDAGGFRILDKKNRSHGLGATDSAEKFDYII